MAAQVHQRLRGSEATKFRDGLQHFADLSEDDEDPAVDRADRYRSDDAFGCDRLLARLMMFHPERTPIDFPHPVDPDPDPPLSDIGNNVPSAPLVSRMDEERGKPITINEVADEPYVPPITIRLDPLVILIRAAARYFNLSVADLLSQRRDKYAVRARHIAMFIGKDVTNRSLPALARRFGGRDHTTVLHAVKKVGARIRSDQWLAYDVAAIHMLAIAADPALGALV